MGPDELIESIIPLLKEIQTEEKKGTAFERYRSQYLWDLGRMIQEYSRERGDTEDSVGQIIAVLRTRSIRCQPVLLKNAETITRVWATKSEFEQETKDAPYGKLRDILKILDPDFAVQHKVSEADRKRLLADLPELTFEDFRNLVKELKIKYDPLGESVSFDEMYDDVYESAELLRRTVESRNTAALAEFRGRFGPKFIEAVRRSIAGMRDEKTLEKLKPGINVQSVTDGSLPQDSLAARLLRVANDLFLLNRSSRGRRDSLRRRIGLSELGKLSTLLKAASDDSEMERYLRSRQVLEKLASRQPVGN